MKKIIKAIFVMALSTLSWGCQDFFITDPDDIINGEDYISAQNEMYTGYYGILSKMQGMADQAIYLTDTRANYIEATVNAPEDLQEVYKYTAGKGNTYADPSSYYALIIACNDYLHKMAQYKLKLGDALDESAQENWKSLISSAIRVKVWTYMRLAQIYGEVIWFNDPLTEMKDLTSKGFTKYTDAHTIINQCLSLLDNGETEIKGLEGVNGSLAMDWAAYQNPENPAAAEVAFWKYVTPDWLLLRCELLLWSGNPDYTWIRDQVLSLLNTTFMMENTKFRLNANLTANYYKAFASNYFYTDETVSSVIYNYNKKQVNKLASHFSTTYPNHYYLRPSTYGSQTYKVEDSRRVGNLHVSGDTLMAKYMYGTSSRFAYASESSVPIQRAHDYHFYLAEAENALGNYDQAESILNKGIDGHFANADGVLADTAWDSRYASWCRLNTNANQGIIGSVNGTLRSFGLPVSDNRIVLCQYKSKSANTENYDTLSLSSTTEANRLMAEEAIKVLDNANIPYHLDNDKIILADETARQKYFDLQLLDEMLKEYVCEGRAYGMMIRIALKYNDTKIIADRVCPKYPASMRDEIRAKIMAGEYFVKWDL